MQEPNDDENKEIQLNHTFPYDAIDLPLDDEFYSNIFDEYPDCDEEQIIENPNDLQVAHPSIEDHSYCLRSSNMDCIPIPISQPMPQLHGEKMQVSQSSMQASSSNEIFAYRQETYSLSYTQMATDGRAPLIEDSQQMTAPYNTFKSNNGEELHVSQSSMENSSQEIPHEEICNIKYQEKAFFLCEICGEQFVDNDDLSIHLINEHQQELIAFPENMFTSNYWKELKDFQSGMENSEQEVCHEKFFNSKNLEKTTALCFKCGLMFVDCDGLSIHLELSDCAPLIQEHQRELITGPNQNEKVHEAILCNKCGDIFEDDYTLNTHLEWHDSCQSRDPLIQIQQPALFNAESNAFTKKCRIDNFGKNPPGTLPRKMTVSFAKIKMATKTSGNLAPTISKSSSCPKCHVIVGSDDSVKRHLANKSCKKQCDSCGSKFFRSHWAKHIIRCSQNLFKSNILHCGNQKSQEKIVEKLELCKMPASIAKSKTASEFSVPSGNLAPTISKRYSCHKCHAIFRTKCHIKKHLANDSCKKKCAECGGKIFIRFWAKHIIRCSQNKTKNDNMLHSGNHKSHDVIVQNIPCGEKSPNSVGPHQKLFQTNWASLKTANDNECSGKQNYSKVLDMQFTNSKGLLQRVPAKRKIIAAKKKLTLSNVSTKCEAKSIICATKKIKGSESLCQEKPKDLPFYSEDMFCELCKLRFSTVNFLGHLPCSKGPSVDAITPTTLQELAKHYDLELTCETCQAKFPSLKKIELHNSKRCYEILLHNRDKMPYTMFSQIVNTRVFLQRLTKQDIKKYGHLKKGTKQDGKTRKVLKVEPAKGSKHSLNNKSESQSI